MHRNTARTFPRIGDLVRLTWDRTNLKLHFFDSCPNLKNRSPRHAGLVSHDIPYLVVRVNTTLAGTFLGLVTPSFGVCWTSADWMELA